eukprot:1984080-Rhodomonas_salina.1
MIETQTCRGAASASRREGKKKRRARERDRKEERERERERERAEAREREGGSKRERERGSKRESEREREERDLGLEGVEEAPVHRHGAARADERAVPRGEQRHRHQLLPARHKALERRVVQRQHLGRRVVEAPGRKKVRGQKEGERKAGSVPVERLQAEEGVGASAVEEDEVRAPVLHALHARRFACLVVGEERDE